MESAPLDESVVKVVYKITYSNGKIYIGQDVTNTLTYFGSVDGRIVAEDFTREQQRDFTIRKEVIWDSNTASNAEVYAKEMELIRLHRSNDPSIGYNRSPKLRAVFGQGAIEPLPQMGPDQVG